MGLFLKKIKMILRDKNCMPTKAHDDDAGYDLKSMNRYVIKPNTQQLVDVGINIKLPSSWFYIWEAQIRPRSGLALKKEITITNSPGTIDSEYIGNIGIIVRNLGTEDFIIEQYDRIAQMVITKIPKIGKFKIVSNLTDTVRSSKGFGSSGK